jgi:hypothetical protein
MFLHLILYSVIQAAIGIVIFQLVDPKTPLAIAYWIVSGLTSLMYVGVQLKDVRRVLLSLDSSRRPSHPATVSRTNNSRHLFHRKIED